MRQRTTEIQKQEEEEKNDSILSHESEKDDELFSIKDVGIKEK